MLSCGYRVAGALTLVVVSRPSDQRARARDRDRKLSLSVSLSLSLSLPHLFLSIFRVFALALALSLSLSLSRAAPLSKNIIEFLRGVDVFTGTHVTHGYTWHVY